MTTSIASQHLMTAAELPAVERVPGHRYEPIRGVLTTQEAPTGHPNGMVVSYSHGNLFQHTMATGHGEVITVRDGEQLPPGFSAAVRQLFRRER